MSGRSFTDDVAPAQPPESCGSSTIAHTPAFDLVNPRVDVLVSIGCLNRAAASSAEHTPQELVPTLRDFEISQPAAMMASYGSARCGMAAMVRPLGVRLAVLQAVDRESMRRSSRAFQFLGEDTLAADLFSGTS